MKIAISLMLIVSSFVGLAQREVRSFTLKEAKDYAIKNSYAVKDKQLEYKKAVKLITETRAMGLPQVSVGLDYQYNPQIMPQAVPAEFFDPNAPAGSFATVAFGIEHQNTANININQLIFDGSYFVGLQAAKVVKLSAMLDIQKEALEIESDVAQSYYGVLTSMETKKFLEENLESLTKNFEETKALYENGFVEEQAADQLELLVNNLVNNLNNANRQVELAMQLLKFNMGIPLSFDIGLSDDIETVMQLEDPSVLMEEKFDLQNHIDYRSLLAEKKGARLQVKNQYAGYLPKINAFARHLETNFGDIANGNNSFNSVFNGNTWLPSTAIGFGLSWDLFKGLGRHATVQKARLDYDRIEIAEELTKNQLSLQYNQALSNYKYAVDNYNFLKRNVEVSRKIRDKTRIKFQEGISSSLDLSQAENQFLETQRNYVQAIQSLLTSKENLEKAIGK